MRSFNRALEAMFLAALYSAIASRPQVTHLNRSFEGLFLLSRNDTRATLLKCFLDLKVGEERLPSLPCIQ